MKRLRCVRIIVLLLCMAGLTKGFSQSTMGTDFWVTFLPNADDANVNLSLIAAGSRPCTGTVTNPRTNWSAHFNVNVGATTNIAIPKSEAYNYEGSDCVTNTALHVVSTDTISLYASNFREYSFDVTDVLPTESLGSEYVIQNYYSNEKGGFSIAHDKEFRDRGDYSEFVVLAVENDTHVTISLSAHSLNGHSANIPFTVTLNSGQVYQILSSDNDLTGTSITVADDKKVAVFAGNLCANTPSGFYCCCDHIVEQMMPVTCWGQHFVVTNSNMRSNDIIRVTALNDNCQIRRNGTLLATINAKQTYQFEITSANPSAYLETSEPAMVYLYYTSAEYGGVNGDPAVVIISPIEQKIGNVTFSTFNSGASQYHFVNVIADADKVSGMRLDGNSIASQFHSVSGNSDYVYARIQINHGSHTLYNSMGGFVAHVYGLGEYESYAYSVGSMAINLTSQMMVNEMPANSYPEGFISCMGETVHFDLNLNFTPSKTLWSFGDGQTGAGCPVNHTYASPGDYPVSCDIFKIEEGMESQVSTVTTQIHVGEVSVTEFSESFCGSYSWHGSVYNSSGDYEFMEHSVYGCDSLLVLHLTVKDGYSATYNETVCDRYPWPSAPGGYLTSTGHYVYEGLNMEGCDSIVSLNLTVGHTPDLVIHGLTHVAVSSDLWPGVYNYCVADSAELGPCTLTWSCSNPDWIFMPSDNPYWCKLIAKTLGTATLTAVATCNSGCDAEYTLEINASYFDVDENVAEGVSMYPNPAQTQVTVCAPQLTGVGMYDSYGQKVKDLVFDRLDVVTVEVGDLRPGVYLVEIVTTTGKTVKRLMINR